MNKLSQKSIKFEDKGRGVLSALVDVKVNAAGVQRTVTYAARIVPEISQKGTEQIFRIDRTATIGGAWLPWEPINTVEYTTSKAAQRAIRQWAAAGIEA